MRAICDRAAVRLPTLYHFFGSKDGLISAVIDHGFDLYLAVKRTHESTGDPVQDLREGWDAHVAFGLENPGFYALMYGQVAPGSSPAAQERPGRLLLQLMREADRQGRLVVSPEQAAAHLLAANVGVTLRQITLARADPDLSAAMREASLSAITGMSPARKAASDLPTDAARLLAHLSDAAPLLGNAETALLATWLSRIAHDSGAGSDPRVDGRSGTSVPDPRGRVGRER